MLELLESRISGSSLFQLLTFLLYKVSINFWSIVSGGDVQALIQVQVQYQQNIVGGLKYVADYICNVGKFWGKHLFYI